MCKVIPYDSRRDPSSPPNTTVPYITMTEGAKGSAGYAIHNGQRTTIMLKTNLTTRRGSASIGVSNRPAEGSGPCSSRFFLLIMLAVVCNS